MLKVDKDRFPIQLSNVMKYGTKDTVIIQSYTGCGIDCLTEKKIKQKQFATLTNKLKQNHNQTNFVF